MSEDAQLIQPTPFRILIDDAMRLAREHIRVIYLPIALPVAGVTALLAVTQALWMKAFLGAPAGNFPQIGRNLLAMVVAVLLTVLVKSLGYAAMDVATLDVVGGGRPDMRASWAFIAEGRVLLTLLVAGLAVLAGTLFCFLPGIFVSLLFAFTVAAMRVEGLRGTSALGRSASLVRRNPHGQLADSPLLKVFLIFFVGGLISYAVNILVQLPFIIAQQVIIFRNVAAGAGADPQAMMAGTMWMQLPAVVLGSLAETAVMLYVTFALALYYFDLRRRREGMDIEAALASLAGNGATAAPGPPPLRP